MDPILSAFHNVPEAFQLPQYRKVLVGETANSGKRLKWALYDARPSSLPSQLLSQTATFLRGFK
jgi:hypothetical protein